MHEVDSKDGIGHMDNHEYPVEFTANAFLEDGGKTVKIFV